MPNNSISRRRFLQSTGAAAIWLPATVKGYTASEMQALYVDGAMQQDISKWELDTPALCVDLNLLESNIATMQSTMMRNCIACRPHAKTHKTPNSSTSFQHQFTPRICLSVSLFYIDQF